MERLEGRALLAVFTVDTAVDENDGDFSAGDFSLREAVAQANTTGGDDVVRFHSSLAGEQITLTHGAIAVNDDLRITGLGADRLTLDAAGDSRIFLINGVNAVIQNLKLTGGNATGAIADGGAILARGGAHLFVMGSWITGNTADGNGGGIAITNSRLDVIGSTIDHNTAADSGGGVYFDGDTVARVDVPALYMANTTLSTNTANGSAPLTGGGGLFVADNHARLVNTTVVFNTAVSEGGGIDTVTSDRTSTTIYNALVAGNMGGGVRSEIGEEVRPESRGNTIADVESSGGLTDGVNRNRVENRDPGSVVDDDLQFNIGPVPTHLPVNVGGAPAVALTRAGTPLETDARGLPRISGVIEPGAVELQETILDLGGSNPTYQEDGPPVRIAPNATITDLDTDTFSFILQVQLSTTNKGPTDRLLILDNGPLTADEIFVYWNGEPIGRVNYNGLYIHFTSHSGGRPVTEEELEFVIRNIAFEASGDNPSEGPRFIQFVNFKRQSVVVNVERNNTPPTLSGIEGTIDYNPALEPSVRLAPQAVVTDNDAEFERGVFRVRVTNSASTGNRLFLQQPFRISSTGVVRFNDLEIGVATVRTGDELQIKLNENATLDVVQSLFRAVRFKTIDSETYSREIAFSLYDGDGATSDPATVVVNVAG